MALGFNPTHEYPLLEKKRDLIPTPLKEWVEKLCPIIGGLSIVVSFSIIGHKIKGTWLGPSNIGKCLYD
jgi:hypothetical protein